MSAWNRIAILVATSRARQDFTHFLSLPLNSPRIQEIFQDFRLRILQDCVGTRGLDETIFQNPGKLHLTVGLMALMGKMFIIFFLAVIYTETYL